MVNEWSRLKDRSYFKRHICEMQWTLDVPLAQCTCAAMPHAEARFVRGDAKQRIHRPFCATRPRETAIPWRPAPTVSDPSRWFAFVIGARAEMVTLSHGIMGL